MNSTSPDPTISIAKPAGLSRGGLRLSTAWRDALLAFFVGRILYSLVGAGIWSSGFRPEEADQFYYGLPPVLDGWAGMLLGVWQRWDALHYQNIALNGYSSAHLTAFFPLYPVLGGLIHRLTGLDILLALILVSNLAFLAALVVMHSLVSRVFSPGVARAALISMVIFPTGFFFYAIYPQSLLLLCAVASVELAMRRKWLAAAATALPAGLAHASALLLCVPLAVEAYQALREAGIRPRFDPANLRILVRNWRLLFAPVAGPLGMVLFYGWALLAGRQTFVAAHTSGWERTFHLPWDAVAAVARQIASTPLTSNELATWLNIVVFLAVIFLTTWSIKRLPLGCWLFLLAAVIFMIVNHVDWNPLLSFFRVILAVFPLFIAIALLGEGRPARRLALFTLSLILALMTSALFFMWAADIC